jgi:hypothetical protein
MLQLTYILVGLMAMAATGATLSTRLDGETRLLMAVSSMTLWAYWALSSLSVTVIANSGSRVTEAYLGLAALGATFGAVMLLSVIRLAFGTITNEYSGGQAPFND